MGGGKLPGDGQGLSRGAYTVDDGAVVTGVVSTSPCGVACEADSDAVPDAVSIIVPASVPVVVSLPFSVSVAGSSFVEASGWTIT